MMSLYYELMGKIEEYIYGEIFDTDAYILYGVLDKIKMIRGIEKIDNTKMLIEADNKLADEIKLKNVVVLITCVIKGGDKFYPQLFLKDAPVA